MLLASRTLWMAGTNTYVVAESSGSPAIIVDAPPDPSGVLGLVDEHGLTPIALLITHGHVDHVGGAGEVARRCPVATYVHPDDDFLTLNPALQLRLLFGGVPPGDFAPPQERTALRGGDVLSLAGFDVEVRHTPGHTPGHCCFYLAGEGILFSGDQLFAGSIGRTDLPGGNYDTLMESMAHQVLTLPDEVTVHPGHGPATTLARERRLNPFLQDLHP